ncbi:hypothetical protein TI39_contig392g00002 [Zymoseptoria brevis]|uniref:Uncharacterized protein n=1 Tax=Zymoseptoria brevis TaxID=1047168 RepID=A0A0F4GNX2_9PEZI|nr:hypothetical protein TI39_contig392g00002 [Zymoseptoria brevis]
MAPTTEKEMRILAIAWTQCAEAEYQPKVDYNKLASLCDFPTAGAATKAYSRARKSFFANGAEASGDGNGMPATPKTPKSTGKKRAAAEDGDTPAETGSVKKRARKTKAQIAAEAAAAAAAADDDDEEGLLAKSEVKDEGVKAEPSNDDD